MDTLIVVLTYLLNVSIILLQTIFSKFSGEHSLRPRRGAPVFGDRMFTIPNIHGQKIWDPFLLAIPKALAKTVVYTWNDSPMSQSDQTARDHCSRRR